MESKHKILIISLILFLTSFVFANAQVDNSGFNNLLGSLLQTIQMLDTFLRNLQQSVFSSVTTTTTILSTTTTTTKPSSYPAYIILGEVAEDWKGGSSELKVKVTDAMIPKTPLPYGVLPKTPSSPPSPGEIIRASFSQTTRFFRCSPFAPLQLFITPNLPSSLPEEIKSRCTEISAANALTLLKKGALVHLSVSSRSFLTDYFVYHVDRIVIISLATTTTTTTTLPTTTTTTLPTTTTTTLPTVIGEFNKLYLSQRDSIIKISKSGTSNDFYFFRMLLLGLLSMYEATGNIYYFQEAINLELNMINSAKDYNGDGFLGWSDETNNPNLKGEGCYLDHIVASVPLARTVRIIKDYRLKSYFSESQKIQNFLEKNIIPRPWATGHTHNTYSHRLAILLDLYKVTGNSAYYKEIIDKTKLLINTTYLHPFDNKAILFNSPLCKSIRQECYHIQGDCKKYPQWSNWEYPYCFPMDTSHANHYVYYVIRAYNDGILYNEDYLNKLIYIFKTYIWDGKYDYVDFKDFIDGADEPETGKYHGTGAPGRYVAGGWVLLGRFDPQIQYVMERFMINGNRSTSIWATLEMYGNLAFNISILGGR